MNAYAMNNSNMTDDFTAHSVPSVELQNWAAYTIDTTKEPFNNVGTYTLHVWAKDVDGVGGSHSLAQMTINVVKEADYAAEVQRINNLIIDTYKTVRANDSDVNEGKGYGGYGGTNCLQDIIDSNGGGNVYNVIISYERWTDSTHTEYTPNGHVRYIYAILKDPSTGKYKVYFTDNMISKNGVPEGEMVSTDLEDFTGAWIARNRYEEIGAIHFQLND